jgi:NACalpha-BTF3-like transcription factor
MKKIITMLLVGLMVLGSASVVYAEEPQDTLKENLTKKVQDLKAGRLGMGKLTEFTEEIHQINALRIERNQLRLQVIERQDQLVDLLINGSEAGNKEALEAAKLERAQIKVINKEIKVLHEQAASTRKTFREAVKNNDLETANAAMETLLNIYNSINDKKTDKVEVLDKIIDILS